MAGHSAPRLRPPLHPGEHGGFLLGDVLQPLLEIVAPPHPEEGENPGQQPLPLLLLLLLIIAIATALLVHLHLSLFFFHPLTTHHRKLIQNSTKQQHTKWIHTQLPESLKK